MATRTVYVHLRAKNSQYNAEMAKSGRITKLAMDVSQRSIADNSRAMRDLEKSAGGLHQTLAKKPKVDVDSSPARRGLTELENDLNKLTFRRAVVTVAVAGLPVAVAGLAGLGAGLAGAVSLFGAAGAGAIAFGATAAASMQRVLDAREELAKAGADREAILGSLTAAQRQALQGVDSLAAAWASFQDRTDPAVLAAMAAAMDALKSALPGLAPLVTRVAGGFEEFMAGIAAGVSGPGFGRFMSDLADLSGRLLPMLGQSAINAGVGVGNLIMAFSGLGTGLAGGLVDLTQKFADWSATVGQSRGFREFIGYVQSVGPDLLSTLGDLASALLDIAIAAAPFAGPMLTIVSTIAQLVTAIGDVHPALLSAVTGVGIFVAASRALGSALIIPSQRLAAVRTQMAALPIASARAGIAMSGMASAMGGKRGLAGAASLGVLALGGLADESTGTGKAMTTLGTTAAGALMGFSVGGPIGAAIGGGVGLLGGLASAFLGSGDAAEGAAGSNNTYTASLNQVSGATTQATRDLIAQALEQKGVLEDLQNLRLDPGVGVEAVMGDPVAIGRINAAYDDQVASLRARMAVIQAMPPTERVMHAGQERDLAAAIKATNAARQGTLAAVGAETAELQGNQAATGRAAAATNGYGAAQRRAAGSALSLAQAVRAAMRAQQAQAQAALAASDKNIAYQQALADARKEARRGARTLDITTQAGRDNRVALNGIAAAWNDLPAKVQNARGAYNGARQSLIATARQMGATKAEARALARQLLEQPKKVTTRAELDKRAAERDARNLKDKLDELDGTTADPNARLIDRATSSIRGVLQQLNFLDGQSATTTVNNVIRTTRIETAITRSRTDAVGPGIQRASGGAIVGPGTGTSDDVLMLGSNGEWVHRTAAVEYYGQPAMRAINEKRIPKEVLAGYANGGLVQRQGVPGYADGGFVGGARRITSGYLDTRLGIPSPPPSLREYNQSMRQLNDAIRVQRRERRQLTRQNRQARDAAKDLREAERDLAKAEDALSNAEGRTAKRRARERMREAREDRNRLRRREKEQSKQAERAQDDLADAKDRHQKKQQKLNDAIRDYAAQQEAAIQQAQSVSTDVQGTGSIFGGGFVDVTSVSARMQRAIGNAAKFGGMLDRLKQRGASPYILSQLVAEGPSEGALIFARQLLSDRAGLEALNAQSARLVQVSDTIGAMVSEPSFLQPLTGRQVDRAARGAEVYAPVTVNAPQNMNPQEVGDATAGRLVARLGRR